MSNKKTKQHNREIRKKLLEDKIKQENPDLCFCKNPSYNENEVVGWTDPIDGFPYHNSTCYTEPIFVCKNCNKKIIESRAY